MKLKPACSWCKDHDQFDENMLMKILVTSFIKLCEYIYSSPLGTKISSSTVNGETNNLMSILHEALSFEDKYVIKKQTTESLGDQTKSIKTEPQQPVAGCSTSGDDDNKPIKVTKLDSENTESNKTVITDEEIHVQSQEKPKTREVHIPKTNTETENDKIQNPRKTVVFMKRAAKNRLNKKNKFKSPGKKSLLKMAKSKRKKLHRPNISKRETVSDFFPVVTLSSDSTLDNEQSKRIKLDLPPPELKPPSFCRCGKSGKYNQLTCLGQRCPCYSMKLPCIGCKCKGCRNPKKGPQNSGPDHFSSALLRSGVRNHADSLYVM